MIEPDLIYEESSGASPDPDSLAEQVLYACSQEDLVAWDALCDVPRYELYHAVAQLQRLGWRFSWATIQ